MKLLQIPTGGRSSHVCPKGHGRAAPASFVRRWLQLPEVPRFEAALKNLAKGKVECARCRTPMGRLRFAGPEIDLCSRCDLVWFDAGELERMPQRSERELELLDSDAAYSDTMQPGLQFHFGQEPLVNLEGVKPGFPANTFILAALCTMAYIIGKGSAWFVFVPREPLRGLGLPAILSTFGHANGMHLASNTLMLVYLGTKVESTLGGQALLKVFGVSAAGSILLEVLARGGPSIGASGAIAGVLACLILTQPQASVEQRQFFITSAGHFTRITRIPLAWMGLAWFASQFVGVFSARVAGDNIGYLGHIGGFLGGAAFTLITDLRVLTPTLPQVKRAVVKKLHVKPLPGKKSG